MNHRERQELDRYITGNYGEDQHKTRADLPEVVECDRCHEEVYVHRLYDNPVLQMRICLTCHIEMGGRV